MLVLLLLACFLPAGAEEGKFLVLRNGNSFQIQSCVMIDEGYEVTLLDGSTKTFKSSETSLRFVSKATDPVVKVAIEQPEPLPEKQIEKPQPPKESKVKYLLRGPEPVFKKPPT